ncbi:hypothetical protein PILCRDRAFT_3835 [Piloderma croceum F 1598]|uniref:N-terminal Ras-GEF domain-containing protein n=1 Tax=Piloderma croceum (strain F 1598) TaxID=765440 RepID=A0A0C3BLL3_PILCF|nr:hypothetical protein PILCRDRAFT_3835 [Piloderma croceum F 1598]
MASDIPDPRQVFQAQHNSIERLAPFESLIKQLIADFSSPREANEYWDTFFATYTAFATAGEVLQSLVR